jgi:hypothetical protein
MRNTTSKDKWLMVLNLAGELHHVLFDGEYVYDYNFPTEKIHNIKTLCGLTINHDDLVEACHEVMIDKKVVCSAFDGTWMTEDITTPFGLSVGSENYWSS